MITSKISQCLVGSLRQIILTIKTIINAFSEWKLFHS